MNQPPQSDDARRLHDLRNAVNAVTMNLALLKRLLQMDQRDRALEVVARMEDACQRSRVLLDDTGSTQAPDRS